MNHPSAFDYNHRQWFTLISLERTMSFVLPKDFWSLLFLANGKSRFKVFLSYFVSSCTIFLRAAGWAGGVQCGAGHQWPPRHWRVIEPWHCLPEGAANCLFSWPDHPLYQFFPQLLYVQNITWRWGPPACCQWCIDRMSLAAFTPFYCAWVLSRSGTTAAMFSHQELQLPTPHHLRSVSAFNLTGPSPLFHNTFSSIFTPSVFEMCLHGSLFVLAQFDISLWRWLMFIVASPSSQYSGVMHQQHILLHIYRNLLICTQADILLCLLHHCVGLNDLLTMSCCHSAAGQRGTKEPLTFIDL